MSYVSLAQSRLQVSVNHNYSSQKKRTDWFPSKRLDGLPLTFISLSLSLIDLAFMSLPSVLSHSPSTSPLSMTCAHSTLLHSPRRSFQSHILLIHSVIFANLFSQKVHRHLAPVRSQPHRPLLFNQICLTRFLGQYDHVFFVFLCE
jgi:hypothetical protein